MSSDNQNRDPRTTPGDPTDMAFRLAMELGDLSARVREAGLAGGAIVNWQPAYDRARSLLDEFFGGPQ